MQWLRVSEHPGSQVDVNVSASAHTAVEWAKQKASERATSQSIKQTHLPVRAAAAAGWAGRKA